MKIAAFRHVADHASARRVGLVVGDGEAWWLHPFPEGVDLVAFLAAESEDRERAADEAAEADGLYADEVVLLPPVQPPAMRGFITFEYHVEGVRQALGDERVPPEWYEAPAFHFMAPHALVGPNDEIAHPPGTNRMDFGLGLAAVICRDIRNVTPEQARGAIGGYCVVNDWSARDVQHAEMRLNLGPGKASDFATTIGPWVVTADELDGHRDKEGFLDLAMSVSLNGFRVGADVSGHMGWTFEQLASHASRGAWVKAGEVLASGTCGSGSLAEAWARSGRLEPPPLRIGDVVEMTVEGIGTIRNRVVRDFEAVPPVPQVRRRPPSAARAPQLAASSRADRSQPATVNGPAADSAGYTSRTRTTS